LILKLGKLLNVRDVTELENAALVEVVDQFLLGDNEHIRRHVLILDLDCNFGRIALLNRFQVGSSQDLI
jgi:hypothetical protein